MLRPITNTEPVDNEFFLRDGAVYFSGLYENDLLKGVAPKDFCCWHYWGRSSTACFLGGIRLRGADPTSFQVLNFAYAMDKTAVYTTSGRIPNVDLAAFQVLDNGRNESGAPQGYAKDSRQIYFHNGDGRVKIVKGAEVPTFCSLAIPSLPEIINGSMPMESSFPRRIWHSGNCFVTGIPGTLGGCTTSTGRSRGLIGTVLQYAPR